MKVYNFDPDDKFLLSVEEANLDPIAKTPMLPAFATFEEPPTNWPEGMIPVFNGTSWDVVIDNFWKPKYREVNYYSGRDTSGVPILPKLDYWKFPFFPNIPRMMNSALFGIRFINRIEIINNYIDNVYKKHQIFFVNQQPIAQIELLTYKTEIEIIIYLIKKSLDDLITMHYVKLYIDEIKVTHRIQIQSIGDLFSERKISKIPQVIDSTKKSIKFDKYEDFLKKINDLHNSLKHDLFLSETDMIIGVPIPTTCAIKTDQWKS